MTEELHNLTIVDQATHKCTYVRTICDDVTAAELLDAYIRRIGRPGGTRGKLVRKQTDIELESDRTLKSIGITDGETLIAYIDMTPGGFMPVASWEALQLTQDILSQLLPDMLYALLLYTDQDKDLVTYVRKNVTELHHMSGNQCTLYVLEKPAKAEGLTVQEFMQKLAKGKLESPTQITSTQVTQIPLQADKGKHEQIAYCYYCGSPMPTDAVFCRKCGKSQSSEK